MAQETQSLEAGVSIVVRPRQSIFQASGQVDGGMFRGRWHFAFDMYRDATHEHFGNLRVLNDDTLDPGATWPLHPHRQNEVVTYVAGGEFRHEDEHGKGGVLHQGGVQHTTVGSGMKHAEINNRPDVPMRFIQIWFMPEKLNMKPSVEQREITKEERTNTWLPMVSSHIPGTLPLRADGSVLSSFLERGKSVEFTVENGRGLYLYVLEGGPVQVNDARLQLLDSAQITGNGKVTTTAEKPTELLLLDVNLSKGWPVE
jgi:redox-sensitive bicupin YhaK (pirin superfamily)